MPHPNQPVEPDSSSPHPFADDAARYRALAARDGRAEGVFYYAVTTTGVYCRPTCAARLALAKHVVFYSTRDAAERAGYRPCLRCSPRGASLLERRAALVARARVLLDAAARRAALPALAATLGVSAHHLHRVFKSQVGMTPRAYGAAQRLQRAVDELREGAPVTLAIHEAGYSSQSRFYEGESGALGMLPSHLRRGGADLTIRWRVRPCVLGHVLIAATERGVCAIAFGDSEGDLARDLRERFPRARLVPDDAALDELAARIVQLVETSHVPADLPLDLLGTAFQQRVWRALREIPAGSTVTYAELARRIGAPGAARAVGRACGKNPIALLVPCHRVVREGGALAGYRWGVERKRALLDRERRRP